LEEWNVRGPVLPLALRTASGEPVALPDPADPAVEVWRDVGGRIGALADRDGEIRRLHLPGVATYEFDLRNAEVVARAARRAAAATIVDQFYRTAVPLILQARGYEVLHASGVASARGVVALGAPKQSGKSTVACALAERGYPLWADDAVVFATDGSPIESFAVPFELRLRPASARHFGRPATERSTATGARRPWSGERAPLAAVFTLERRPAGAPLELSRLDGGVALTAVLANAYSFTWRESGRKAAMMRQYLALVSRVPVYSLRYPSGLEHLDAIVDAIESVLAAAAGSAGGERQGG
jgi:hypothetical protein